MPSDSSTIIAPCDSILSPPQAVPTMTELPIYEKVLVDGGYPPPTLASPVLPSMTPSQEYNFHFSLLKASIHKALSHLENLEAISHGFRSDHALDGSSFLPSKSFAEVSEDIQHTCRHLAAEEELARAGDPIVQIKNTVAAEPSTLGELAGGFGNLQISTKQAASDSQSYNELEAYITTRSHFLAIVNEELLHRARLQISETSTSSSPSSPLDPVVDAVSDLISNDSCLTFAQANTPPWLCDIYHLDVTPSIIKTTVTRLLREEAGYPDLEYLLQIPTDQDPNLLHPLLVENEFPIRGILFGKRRRIFFPVKIHWEKYERSIWIVFLYDCNCLHTYVSDETVMELTGGKGNSSKEEIVGVKMNGKWAGNVRRAMGWCNGINVMGQELLDLWGATVKVDYEAGKASLDVQDYRLE